MSRRGRAMDQSGSTPLGGWLTSGRESQMQCSSFAGGSSRSASVSDPRVCQSSASTPGTWVSVSILLLHCDSECVRFCMFPLRAVSVSYIAPALLNINHLAFQNLNFWGFVFVQGPWLWNPNWSQGGGSCNSCVVWNAYRNHFVDTVLLCQYWC